MQEMKFTLDLLDLVIIVLTTSGLSVVIYSEWGLNR